ncbi:RagB/SusD family nutrient uptake outer membrane protein, partial [Draconibacterium sp.]|nr:RagB/SusD family nutrient uptake outer membrane protein [Draconibacterium sp.]
MKRIKILPLILTVLIIMLVSCSEDWLKPDPLSFFTPENVFIDEAGFEAALVRCKKEMNAENHGYIQFIACENAYSDLAVPLRQSDFRKNTPSTSLRQPILTFFLDAYGFIKNANTIISRIDDIEWTDQNNRNRILSEALWFRSYWYYRLVNTYGDIPWEGKELKGPKLDYNSTSRWAILNKIQNDLEYAEEWLPVTSPKLGNVTKGAANHLLAKIYLANGEFDKAIAATSAVINGPYALMTQRFGSYASQEYYNVLWDLHRVENKNLATNTETIYATVDRLEAPPDTRWDEVGTYSWRSYSPSYWKVLDATGNRATNWNTSAGDTLGIGNGDVRTNHFFNYWLWNDENYTWKTTPDMRRSDSNWIEMGDSISEIITVREGSPNYGEPLSKKYYKSLADTTDTWYPWPNYKLFVPTPNYRLPMGGPGDWYIFRLAETYLLRAEAYYWKGEFGLAADDINKVRDRAQAPLITAGDVTIDYIFEERARELYTEEPRHTEMVRVSYIFAKLNRDGYSLESISEKNWYHDRVMRVNPFYSPPIYVFWDNTATLYPEHMLWPVPQEVITANTLGVINQNVG